MRGTVTRLCYTSPRPTTLLGLCYISSWFIGKLCGSKCESIVEGIARSSSGNDQRMWVELGCKHSCFRGNVFLILPPAPALVTSSVHVCPLLIKDILRGRACGRLNLALVSLSRENGKFYSIPLTELLGHGMRILMTCFWGVRRKNHSLQFVPGLQVQVAKYPRREQSCKTNWLAHWPVLSQISIPKVIKLKTHSPLA